MPGSSTHDAPINGSPSAAHRNTFDSSLNETDTTISNPPVWDPVAIDGRISAPPLHDADHAIFGDSEAVQHNRTKSVGRIQVTHVDRRPKFTENELHDDTVQRQVRVQPTFMHQAFPVANVGKSQIRSSSRRQQGRQAQPEVIEAPFDVTETNLSESNDHDLQRADLVIEHEKPQIAHGRAYDRYPVVLTQDLAATRPHESDLGDAYFKQRYQQGAVQDYRQNKENSQAQHQQQQGITLHHALKARKKDRKVPMSLKMHEPGLSIPQHPPNIQQSPVKSHKRKSDHVAPFPESLPKDNEAEE